MRVAVIEGGVVVNVIEATTAQAQKVYPNAVIKRSAKAGKGWVLDGDTLKPPTIQQPERPFRSIDVLSELNKTETDAFIDFLQTNSIITAQRATRLKRR